MASNVAAQHNREAAYRCGTHSSAARRPHTGLVAGDDGWADPRAHATQHTAALHMATQLVNACMQVLPLNKQTEQYMGTE
jgi:hypothetical protein